MNDRFRNTLVSIRFQRYRLSVTVSYTENTGRFLQLQEAEQTTLGYILLNPERFLQVKTVLKLKDFRYDKHRIIFGAMQDMENQNIAIDVYTIWCFLDERGQLDAVGRGSYLTYLCELGWRCEK